MTVSIFSPMAKFGIGMAKSIIMGQLASAKARHALDHRVVDAITAAEAAINGALSALENL